MYLIAIMEVRLINIVYDQIIYNNELSIGKHLIAWVTPYTHNQLFQNNSHVK